MNYFLVLLIGMATPCLSQVDVNHLRSANRVNPLGVDDPHPPFSWQLSSKEKNILQKAYEIRLSDGFTTGKIYSPNSIGIRYSGPSLAPGTRYSWQVRVWDNQGNLSSWSMPAWFQTGLQNPGNWKAQWIVPGLPEDSLSHPPPIFRKEWDLSQKIKRATLYITAHGLYEATLNGQRIGDAFFTPGWTSYDHRLQYQCYDVTAQLKEGRNQVQVTVGDGWWRGVFGGAMTNNHYGKDAALLFQLQVDFADGSRGIIVSDSSWTSGTGPIRYADLYNGEVYDQRMQAASWTSVKTMEGYSKDNLVATMSEPVTRQEVLPPVKIFTDPKGERLIDFGQNLSGWVRFQPRGKAGDTITISHAEALDKEGDFYTGNLRAAKARDVYVLNGNTTGRLEPHFTFHGFRYIRVEGWQGELNPGDFEAVALYSNLDRTGTFTCSNPLLNQLQHNITWSQNDNFLDIPTDCPQRSERYGWTGDVQIFARTASFNRNVHSFLSKWLKDLAADQGSNGGMPAIIPDLNGHRNTGPKKGFAGWGDAATIIPWTLFRAYGDTSLLEAQYASMKGWVHYILSCVDSSQGDYLWKADGYGDWLAPDTLQTPVPFISQCYFAWSAHLLALTAGVLHRKEDSLYYTGLYQKARSAFLKEYIPLPLTQCGYILPIYLDLLPDSLRVTAVQKLVGLIQSHQDHLSTGFLGTPYLLPVLTRYGYTDLAYTVLLQETPPSWLYPVKMGATTIWEKWDAITPDGVVGDKSLNHYAYGAVGDWLYREVAGISEEEPGYRTIRIQPHVGGGLQFARASYECPYGTIVSEWKRVKGRVRLHVEIPPNTRAVVYWRGDEGAGTSAKPIWVGSGVYYF